MKIDDRLAKRELSALSNCVSATSTLPARADRINGEAQRNRGAPRLRERELFIAPFQGEALGHAARVCAKAPFDLERLPSRTLGLTDILLLLEPRELHDAESTREPRAPSVTHAWPDGYTPPARAARASRRGIHPRAASASVMHAWPDGYTPPARAARASRREIHPQRRTCRFRYFSGPRCALRSVSVLSTLN